MGMSERIKERRIAMGFTQEELAGKLGLQKSAIAKYENGRVENIKRSVIQSMSEILETAPSYLMGWDDLPEVDPEHPSKGAVVIPVLGMVAAGAPIYAVEDILDYEEIPEEWAKSGQYFALQIKGDSMSPRIMEKDVVIVRQQEDAESGDIVIAKVNGDDACCKKLLKHKNGISLVSYNSAYEPMVFMDSDVQEIPVSIIGKVVELRGKF